MKSMVGIALALAANYGIDVPNFQAKKLSRYPRNHVHTRDRESRRAKMQGLHNTADGRIERKKGVEIWFGHPFCYGCASSHESKWPPENIGYGETRAEAIRAYRKSFLNTESKK